MQITTKENMIKKTPYQLKNLTLFFDPKVLSMDLGTIETAIFQEPKLLTHVIRFPNDFDFSPFREIINPKDDDIPLTISHNHSNKNDIIFAGLSSTLYSKFYSESTIEERIKLINSFRFQIILEQQSIISLISVFETFITNVLKDYKKEMRFIHNFDDIIRVLNKCEIKFDELDYFKNEIMYSRVKEIIDYSFNLRNLFVHNGGIVDEMFCKRCGAKISEDEIGKLIRISFEDYTVIRQWLSFFIQEICRVIEGYDDVWIDYLLSTGILLHNVNVNLKTFEGGEIQIPLEEGIELMVEYENENPIEILEKKTDEKNPTYSFQCDIGKIIERKSNNKHL